MTQSSNGPEPILAPQAPPVQQAVLVAGAGGFIGGHLVAALLERGVGLVRAVDKKPLDEWFQVHDAADSRVLDLRSPEATDVAVNGVEEVFNLACDMGGMGFIETHKADCMSSVVINTHLIRSSANADVRRYFYASSACVYAQNRQQDTAVTALVESDAYPADPEDGYGWEKLFSERMCRHAREDYGLETRVARFHNVYGPEGSYDGGREKAPAAICRKVGSASLNATNTIEIWGDGEQTRSFLWIDDCIRGIFAIHEGDNPEPVNLGSDELVSINQLVDLVEARAGLQLEREYILDAPKGVRGRNSDNAEFERRYGWAPSTSLKEGMDQTYAWVYERMVADRGLTPSAPVSKRTGAIEVGR